MPLKPDERIAQVAELAAAPVSLPASTPLPASTLSGWNPTADPYQLERQKRTADAVAKLTGDDDLKFLRRVEQLKWCNDVIEGKVTERKCVPLGGGECEFVQQEAPIAVKFAIVKTLMQVSGTLQEKGTQILNVNGNITRKIVLYLPPGRGPMPVIETEGESV